MLATRAYGLGNDAAEELAVLSLHIMPGEEFGIVYPRSGREPYSEGGRTCNYSEHPSIRGGI